MHRRLIAALLLAACLTLAVSGPALGISSIKNSLDVNERGRYVSDNERTTTSGPIPFGSPIVTAIRGRSAGETSASFFLSTADIYFCVRAT